MTLNATPHSTEPSSRRRRKGLLTRLLWVGIGFVALINLCGRPWLTSQLEHSTDGSHSHVSLRLDNFGKSMTNQEKKEKQTKKCRGEGIDKVEQLERHIAAEVRGATKVQSCRRYRKEGDQIVFGSQCQEKLRLMDPQSRKVVVFNPAPYERFWCQMHIPSKGGIVLSDSEAKELCKEPPQMLEQNPTVDGTGMPHVPIQMVALGQRVDLQPIPCDIPCEHSGKGIMKIYQPVGMEDINITFSMESSAYYPHLTIHEYSYRNNSFFSTPSFRAEIPISYFSESYNMTTPAVNYDDAIRGATFLSRHCSSKNNREAIVKHLMNTMRVDSMSKCLRNSNPEVEDDGSVGAKIAIMKSYLFHLAFENSLVEDYITEKLWATLKAGTLPVYYGAPNVREHAPPNSIILVEDFNSTDELAVYLDKVAANKTLYESYHEWRKKPLSVYFHKKYDFLQTHGYCRLCRWAYATKYGYPWDHKSQTVQNLRIPRELKYATSGQVIQPFRDSFRDDSSWFLGRGAGWQRTVWEHDGVLDIHFEALSHSTRSVYRMEFPMEGELRASNETSCSRVFTLQNDVSRVTVVTSWEAIIESPQSNMIAITLEASFDMLRVRVIVEDVDRFHKDADKVASYFGDLMANKDFFSPLEAFIVEVEE